MQQDFHTNISFSLLANVLLIFFISCCFCIFSDIFYCKLDLQVFFVVSLLRNISIIMCTRV